LVGVIPGRGGEGAAELPDAEMRDLGQTLHRKVLRQGLPRDAQHIANPVGSIDFEQGRARVVPAGAPAIDDEHAGDRLGDLRPKSSSIKASVMSIPVDMPADVHSP
jgi:hypothetical protein